MVSGLSLSGAGQGQDRRAEAALKQDGDHRHRRDTRRPVWGSGGRRFPCFSAFSQPGFLESLNVAAG